MVGLRLEAPEGYMTVAELAAALDVSRQRVHQLLRAGGIETERADRGMLLIRVADAAALAGRRAAQARAERAQHD